MISFDPRTRVETTSSPSTSSVTAGPPVRITSMSAIGSPSIPGRSESLGSMQVTTAILGVGCAPSFLSYFLAYVWFAFSALSIILIANLHIGYCSWPEEPPLRVQPRPRESLVAFAGPFGAACSWLANSPSLHPPEDARRFQDTPGYDR